ncbi:MAG: DUF1559 family PulG-like putative transporter [Isosphaeraceae bacterium]
MSPRSPTALESAKERSAASSRQGRKIVGFQKAHITDRSRGRDTLYAFTLIETLVVIVVIAIVAALIVAAATSARESARRAQCTNNLRQISLGIHEYDSVNGVFPPAYGGGGNGISFLVAILPYVDQQPLYNMIDMKSGPFMTVMCSTIGTYLCPSDGLVRSNPLAGTNYAGCQGVGVQTYGYNGVFAIDRTIGYNAITDGASQTVAVSEWVRGSHTGAMRHNTRSVFLTPESYTSRDQLDLFASMCLGLDPLMAPLSPMTVGAPWTHGDFGHSLYNHTIGPNRRTCLNGSAHQIGAWTAKSFHPGSVNSLFADGHVRRISWTVNVQVWRALGSRNGGEVVASGSF